jgi:hypothetical protein
MIIICREDERHRLLWLCVMLLAEIHLMGSPSLSLSRARSIPFCALLSALFFPTLWQDTPHHTLGADTNPLRTLSIHAQRSSRIRSLESSPYFEGMCGRLHLQSLADHRSCTPQLPHFCDACAYACTISSGAWH